MVGYPKNFNFGPDKKLPAFISRKISLGALFDNAK